MAVQGSVIQWVSDHRKHHAHTDEEGDPHSPHAGFAGGGVRGTLRGLFHAHVGWILTEEGGAARAKYAKDLVEDRGMKRISDNFHWLVLLSLADPGGRRLRADRRLVEGRGDRPALGRASSGSSCCTT